MIRPLQPGLSTAAALMLLATLSASAQAPLETTFNYQGRLESGGSSANGLYDLRFRLYDGLLGGNQVGGTICLNDVSVVDGLLTVSLDFGAQFNGQRRFLEIDVRADGGLDCLNSAGFVMLGPRQPISGAPYALGPWQPGAGTLTYTDGKVGIGATAPATLLHMLDGDDPTLRIQSDGTNEISGRLSLRQSNLTGADFYYDGTNTVDGVSVELFAQGISAGVPFFISNRSPTVGFVGIGTSNPQYGLDVAAPGFPAVNVASPNTSGTWLNLGNTGTGGTNWQLISTGSGNGGGAGNLLLGRGPTPTSSGPVLTLTSAGNVGIGTLAPIANLHVQGGSGFNHVRADSASDLGTWLRLANSSAGGHDWGILATGAANAEGAGNLLFTDQTSGGVRMVIDTFGRVGIGTSTPVANLHVSSSLPTIHLSNTATGAQLRMFPQSIGGRLETASNHPLQLGTNALARLTIDTNGHVFINNMNSRNTLQVGWDNSNDELTVDTSTRRHKANIAPLADDFERILDAEPKTYTRPDDPVPDRWEIGYIAEDLHDLGLTHLVFYDDEGLPLAINYSRIPLYLAEVLKRQRDQLAAQRGELAGQREELTALRAENAELRHRLDRLERLVQRRPK